MAKTGLQKLTLSDKFKWLMSLQKIEPQHLASLNLTESQYRKIEAQLGMHAAKLKDEELSQFMEKIYAILPEETRNDLWQGNHVKIQATISNLLQEYNRMPTKVEVARRSGLSRQTVYKHLDNYRQHPIYKEQLSRFKILESSILTHLYQFAIGGDVSAAKLFLTATGGIPTEQRPTTAQVQNQNNYIQINGMVISQEAVQNLTNEQISTLESVLKEVQTLTMPAA